MTYELWAYIRNKIFVKHGENRNKKQINLIKRQAKQLNMQE